MEDVNKRDEMSFACWTWIWFLGTLGSSPTFEIAVHSVIIWYFPLAEQGYTFRLLLTTKSTLSRWLNKIGQLRSASFRGCPIHFILSLVWLIMVIQSDWEESNSENMQRESITGMITSMITFVTNYQNENKIWDNNVWVMCLQCIYIARNEKRTLSRATFLIFMQRKWPENWLCVLQNFLAIIT